MKDEGKAPQGRKLSRDYSRKVEGRYSERVEGKVTPREKVTGEGAYMCLGDVFQQHIGSL